MIESFVLAWTLLLLRTASFVAVAPPWGIRAVPASIKIGLAVALTLVWGPVYFASIAPVTAAGTQSTHPWLAIGWLAARETLIGLSLGWLVGLLFAAVKIAGAYIAQEMGLTMASLASPLDGAGSSVVTQILEAIATLLFFAVGGHHLVLRIFGLGLELAPIGAEVQLPEPGWLIGMIGRVEQAGLEIAAPVGIGLFLSTIILAVLMRWAPQFNLLTFGAPVRLLAGLGLTALLLPEMISRMLSELQRWASG